MSFCSRMSFERYRGIKDIYVYILYIVVGMYRFIGIYAFVVTGLREYGYEVYGDTCMCTDMFRYRC